MIHHHSYHREIPYSDLDDATQQQLVTMSDDFIKEEEVVVVDDDDDDGRGNVVLFVDIVIDTNNNNNSELFQTLTLFEKAQDTAWILRETQKIVLVHGSKLLLLLPSSSSDGGEETEQERELWCYFAREYGFATRSAARFHFDAFMIGLSRHCQRYKCCQVLYQWVMTRNNNNNNNADWELLLFVLKSVLVPLSSKSPRSGLIVVEHQSPLVRSRLHRYVFSALTPSSAVSLSMWREQTSVFEDVEDVEIIHLAWLVVQCVRNTFLTTETKTTTTTTEQRQLGLSPTSREAFADALCNALLQNKKKKNNKEDASSPIIMTALERLAQNEGL
eukprot:PhM_4_TR12461/c1_g1_i1/m.55755